MNSLNIYSEIYTKPTFFTYTSHGPIKTPSSLPHWPNEMTYSPSVVSAGPYYYHHLLHTRTDQLHTHICHRFVSNKFMGGGDLKDYVVIVGKKIQKLFLFMRQPRRWTPKIYLRRFVASKCNSGFYARKCLSQQIKWAVQFTATQHLPVAISRICYCLNEQHNYNSCYLKKYCCLGELQSHDSSNKSHSPPPLDFKIHFYNKTYPWYYHW